MYGSSGYGSGYGSGYPPSRGAMLGSGGVSDGYEVGSKRQRMMESNPYFAVGSAPGGYQSYGYGSGFQPSGFPVVRLRGLPFNCTDIDIIKFFAGLDIVDVLLVHKNGRFSGEAFVVLASPMQADLALNRDRQNMGRRYVEVFRCKKQDYYNAVASEVKYEGIYDNDRPNSPPGQSRGSVDKDQLEYTEFLRMRGLPFSVTKEDIVKFFGEFNVTEDKIHIACRADGKTTGEAYVEFASADEAKRAMCKDRKTIGTRYVELFPSTPDEVRRAESRSRQ
uniref:RRM domain-containing protein n=1 Tax=Opuntia streptacantha TaxID=393608 RepID=A0A7C8Z8M7_OPUST